MNEYMPQGITAILDNGLKVPCDISFDGYDDDGTPRFRVTAEVNWAEHPIRMIMVRHWPVNTGLAIDLPGHTVDEAMAYAAQVRWVDLTGRN